MGLRNRVYVVDLRFNLSQQKRRLRVAFLLSFGNRLFAVALAMGENES
jgi:hypothetical protein